MPSYLSDQGLVLATAVLDHFEKHPEEHRQSSWWCNTGCCFAGGIARAVGAEPIKEPVFGGGRSAWQANDAQLPDGTVDAISTIARRALGLDDDDDAIEISIILFHSENTLPALRQMVKDLAAGTMISPPYERDED